jgi:anaerobic selenocysteine-containing dehydrogenase
VTGFDGPGPASEHLSICRCCGALCGVVVSVRGDQVFEVRGDDGHPLSGGYICPKGRALPAFHHHPRRLVQPSLRGAAASWDVVLEDLAAGIDDLRTHYGPDSIAAYTSTGQYFDTAAIYAENRFYGGLGTRQRYTAATVDCAPTWRAAELVTGFAKPFHPIWTPEETEPGLVIMIGFNPVVSHVYFGAQLPDPIRRIRAFQSRGGEVWVLDPRRTETAVLADRHLAPRPNTDAFILAWLVREILAAGADDEELQAACHPDDINRLRQAVGPFDLHTVSRYTEVDESDLLQLLHTIRNHGRVAVISGTGIAFGRLGVLTEWLRWALLIVTGSLDREGGMRFNTGDTVALEKVTWTAHAPPEGGTEPGPASRPDLHGWLGELPCVALVDEIEAGNVRGLFVAGGSPLTAFPDPNRTRAALEMLSFLAVVDVVGNDLTDMATHVLPVAGQLERDDLLRSYIPAVVSPPPEVRPAWWVFARLGQRLGIDVLDGIEPDEEAGHIIVGKVASGCRESADKVMAAGPRGLRPPKLYGWIHERVLPGGKWRLAPQTMIAQLGSLLQETVSPLVLVSHRAMHNHNSVPYARKPNGPRTTLINISPADASGWGIAAGDQVRISSASGAVEGSANLDRRLRPGIVSLNHGWLQPNVAHLISGVEIDPLSGQPAQTGVPVTIERLDSERSQA